MKKQTWYIKRFADNLSDLLQEDGGRIRELPVKIRKCLGHSQVSSKANIYAHVMEEADQCNADILADVFLKKA